MYTVQENKTEKNNLPIVIFLMGPTASGKTELAIKLQKVLPIELISVDSALVYKEMNIGTGKPNIEELRSTPHYLLDIIDPSQTYSVADFYRDALIKIKEIIISGHIPLLVGGTMFYFKILLNGFSPLPPTNPEVRKIIIQQAKEKDWGTLYQKLKDIDPISATRIHPNDLQRIIRALEVFFISGKTLTDLIQIPGNIFPYHIYQFAIVPTCHTLLYQRIERRFYQMLDSGFEEEVQMLFSRGDLHADMPSIRCIGYRQMWSYLAGKISYDEMIYQSIYATKKLIKHQNTWLRRWKNIHWLYSEKPKQALQDIFRIVSIAINK